MTGRQYLLLGVVFFLSLAVRIFLLSARWINPDEGAHLMDAMLVLEGKIPFVDFHSRQPVYVLVNALVLKLFGMTLTAGRLLPLLCSLLTGVVIFYTARRIFNQKAATLAAILFLLLPLEIMNSVVVKTEPLNTLIICISMYLLIRGFQDRFAVYWGLSGVLAALAYYVRQSALVVPLTAILVFLPALFRRRAIGFREMLAFSAGYALVVVVVLFIYSRFFDWWELLEGGLNPIGFLLQAVLKSLGMAEQATGGSIVGRALDNLGGGTQLYVRYAKSAVLLHLFLLAGLVLSIIDTARKLFSRQGTQARPAGGVFVLSLWFFGLTLSYGYYLLDRGFYIDYAREFTPPLVILFAGWVVDIFGENSEHRGWGKLVCIAALPAVAGFILISAYPGFPKALQLPAVGLCTFAAYLTGELSTRSAKLKLAAWLTVFLAMVFGMWNIHLPALVFGLAAAALLAIAYASIGMAASRLTAINSESWKRAICLSTLAGSLSFSIAYSVPVIDRRYDSIWSTESLKEVSELIASYSEADDQVMSGGVVWEFAAGRHPFLMISHPLIYRDRMPAEDKEVVGKALRDSPPKVIVKDGYTEKTYFQHFSWIDDLLNQRYSVYRTIGTARFPVSVYFRLDG